MARNDLQSCEKNDKMRSNSRLVDFNGDDRGQFDQNHSVVYQEGGIGEGEGVPARPGTEFL